MKFSIILPTYNRGYLISKAIESVISQSYKKFELIIIDDGSTDNTKYVVNDYIKKHSNIRYFYQKNQERSIARNNGIGYAKGDWICFLDSDDIYHTNHLEAFYCLIKKNTFKKGLYFSGLSYGKYSELSEEYDLSHKNNLEFIFLNTIGTPRACVPIEILKKYKFDENFNIGEDRELWARILNNYPLYFHKKKTFIEIEHLNRSINKSTSKEGLKTLKKTLKKHDSMIRRSVKKKVMSNTYFNISKSFLKKNSFLKAFFFILASIVINFSNPQIRHRLLLLLSLLNLYNSKIKKEYTSQ